MKNKKQKETKPFCEQPDEQFEIECHPITSIAHDAVNDVMNHFMTVSEGWNKMESKIESLKKIIERHQVRWANAMRGFSTEERLSWNEAYPDLVPKEVTE